VIEALRTSILVPHDHLHTSHERVSYPPAGWAFEAVCWASWALRIAGDVVAGSVLACCRAGGLDSAADAPAGCSLSWTRYLALLAGCLLRAATRGSATAPRTARGSSRRAPL
jgi:hypothetical protein